MKICHKTNSAHFGLYFILLTGFLNPVLRPSVQSNLTLFRILLPVTFFLINKYSQIVFTKLCKWILGLGILGAVQYLITHYYLYYSLKFDIYYYLEYYFHYTCILIIVAIVKCLELAEGEAFYRKFFSFSKTYVKFICSFVFFYTVIMGNELRSFSLADNINNVSCILIVGTCFFVADSKENKYELIWSILCLSLTLYNDSKAAFFGGILVIILYLSYILSYRIINDRINVRKLLIIFFGIVIVNMVYIFPMINGYSLESIVVNPLYRIVHNQPYKIVNTSTTYRTNATIAAFRILKKSYGFGVGMGNTARALRLLMMDAYGGVWALKANGFSLHNWWLELMCDFGWIMIILQLKIFIKEVIMFINRKRNSNYQLYSAFIILTFPIWSIGASGLTTEYFTIAAMVYACMISKNSYKEYIAKNAF